MPIVKIAYLVLEGDEQHVPVGGGVSDHPQSAHSGSTVSKKCTLEIV